MTTLFFEHSSAIENHVRITVSTKNRAVQTVLMPKEALYKFLLDKNECLNSEMRPFRRVTKIVKEKRP